MTTASIPLLATTSTMDRSVYHSDNVSIQVPLAPLANGALEIHASSGRWTSESYLEANQAIQRIASVWKESGFAENYLVIGKGNELQVVPYLNKTTQVGIIWQQVVVVWKLIFGAKVLTDEQTEAILAATRVSFTQSTPSAIDTKISEVSNDAFYNPAVINSQLVLEGDLVNVLYSYAPLSTGGPEKLHFLFVPKRHDTQDLTNEEFIEASQLMDHVTERLSQTRHVYDAYRYYKVGVIVGQSVPHIHWHLVLTTTAAGSLIGKINVFRNMLLGSSRLSANELQTRVTSYAGELKKVE